MKKKLTTTIIIANLLFCYDLQAQVGIGNSNPSSTLEITAKNPTGTTTNVDGVLIPRVDRQRALSMTSIPESTLIYVNNIATGTATGIASNITAVGFYYFDTTANKWMSLGASGDFWSLSGNTGTTAGTHFLGTTDAQDLRFKTAGTDRLNISNTNGQVQSYFAGTSAAPAFSWNTDSDTGLFRSAANNLSMTTNAVEGLRLRENSNVTIGGTYAGANAAPTNGLRVEGASVIGKASGEDTRDILSAHTSATSFQNVTGYPSNAKKRAISGYADDSGIGVFGVSNKTGYGVVGLTQSGTISSFVQTGEGVLGQADGSTDATITKIPIGVHGIIDESVTGKVVATPVLGENNNITVGIGLGGGSYNGSAPAIAGVYGNIGTKVTPSSTNSYQFGVVGDVLLLGVAGQPDATGGVLGTNASSDFGILGYVSKAGTNYSVYGGGTNHGISAGNTGKSAATANNTIGLGINGGFMGGYVKGNQYGLMSKGEEFGLYVQGNSIVNKPIVQLSENNIGSKSKMYVSTSTEVDVTTRGTAKLNNGEIFVAFKDAFKNIVSKNEPINVTITPTEETNGVFVSRVTSEGFYVKENQKGTSNASFNWVAIGTKAGYENGVELSEVIMNKNFDNNMNEVMNNDGQGGESVEGKPIYFDGSQVKFERIPQGLVKYNTKTLPKK